MHKCGARSWVPSVQILAPTYANANYRYPGWMADDGAEHWTFSSTLLWSTVDRWATTRTVYTFPMPVRGVRQCADGELLVALQGDAATKGVLMRSTGYSRATGTATSWAQVLECSNVNTYATGDWNMWVGGGVCAVAEYGAKTAGANARYAYVSTDDGLTWRIVADRFATGLHWHGIAYDTYGDLLWVAMGDDTSGIAYSSNWRDATPTWTTVSAAVQPVGIYPLRDRIVFGSDDANNGPYVIERADLTVVRSAFKVTQDAILNVLGGMPFRRAHSESYPLLLPYSRVPGSTGASYLLATMDGLSWWRVYTDTVTYDGLGLQTALGPDAAGNITGYHPDARNAAGTRVTFTAPTWTERQV